MNQDFNLLDILRLLLTNSKTILLAGFISALVAAGISLFLKDYYEASTTFYAASPDLALPSPLGNTDTKKDIYGNDYDIDRLLSIAKSRELMHYLIEEFSLYDHYNIDSTKPKAKFKIQEKLLKHYEVHKTKFGAISLIIEDHDPAIAAQMANAARDRISEIAQTIIKGSQAKTLKNYNSSIKEKEKMLVVFNDSLRTMKAKYNVIDVGFQAEVLSTNSTKVSLNLSEAKGRLYAMQELNLPPDSINKVAARVEGLKIKKKNLDQQLKSFNQGAAMIQALETQVQFFRSQIGLSKERYQQLLSTYNAPFSTIHVIEEADIPVVKSRPIRWVIVLLAAIIASLLASLFILAKDNLRGHSLTDQ